MAKTIAVFCDGTWNSKDMEETTNLREIFEACRQTPHHLPIYISGVGTNRAGNVLRRTIVKVGGGAFGWGLNGKIRQAYRAIAEVYEPGDIIMIFGFSRGAYTARSLAGMIRKCGIVARDQLNGRTIGAAFRLYRATGPENHPDQPHIMAARAALSPDFATSEKDRQSRDDPSRTQIVNIAYMGIWDTVGALGLPEPLFGRVARWWNQKYDFHDTHLSSMVKAARHALALDERRKLYAPITWTNLNTYRRADGSESLGLNQGTVGSKRRYQQLWFVGGHSVVGGSSDIEGLVAPPRDWVLAGAKERGLLLKPDAVFGQADVVTSPDVGSESRFYSGIAPSLLEWRSGPDTEAGLHETVAERIAARPEYRPQSLVTARADLFDQPMVA